MNELIPSQGILTKTAWQLPENLSEADWTKAGRALARIEGSLSWWLGDWWPMGTPMGSARRWLILSTGKGQRFKRAWMQLLYVDPLKPRGAARV